MYASDTDVAVEKSMREIQQMVRRAGAKTWYQGEDSSSASIAFELGDRRILFELPIPQEAEFTYVKRTVRGKTKSLKRNDRDLGRALDQAKRSRWRALMLTIKAKLVSVDARIETVEEAFLAQVVMVDKNGKSARFYKFAKLAIENVYKAGQPALPSGPSGMPVEPFQIGGGE